MPKKNWKLPRLNRPTPPPSLRFNAFAWGKLIYLRDRGNSEIGGFGLSAADDPLLIVDVLTVQQCCTPITVKFDDAAVADLFDELVDQGIPPARFGRIWIHTHPGDCPLPSSTDETTFERVFGRTDWSVMAIVAKGGATYARLAFHAGPGGSLKIPVRVDYGQPFDAADWESWEGEYQAHIVAETLSAIGKPSDAAPGTLLDRDLPLFWDEEDFYEGEFRARPF